MWVQVCQQAHWLTWCVVLQLSSMNRVKVYGPKPEKGRAALCSFNVEGLHATDISTLLDQEGECPTETITDRLPACPGM